MQAKGSISFREYGILINNYWVRDRFRVMEFNVTFNNISAILWQSVFWWRKPVYLEKTIDLPQVTDKFIT
jgi:hypothetical protein